jgi:transcriptional regulator with XRE-family HTH domain
MAQRERIESAMERAGFASQQAIADACGVRQPSIHALLTGLRPMRGLMQKIAEKTGVSYEWLRFGDESSAPSWATEKLSARESANVYSTGRRVDIVGCVTAGDGDLAGFDDLVESVEIPPNWKIVVVHGMSAYPVFYPNQLAWVDMNRAASPATMTERQYIDLHDNVVVVQGEIKGKRVGMLKRFNYQPENPHKFSLSSLDTGRSSPWVSPDDIDVILPVVGSWWEDPRRPRKKRYHARSVIVKLIDE